MAFDPDAYLSELAQGRAEPKDPGATPSYPAMPDYAHDPVPPERAGAARSAVQQAIAAPGFDNLGPDEQRKAIVDAVHGITRAPESPGEPASPGFMESLVHSAGKAVPFGHQTGAALASAPLIGNGRSYRDNYDALERDTAAGEAAHPVAGVLGRTAGLGLTTLASGGFGAGAGGGAAVAPTVVQATTRAAAPMAVNTAAGGAQGAADAASEGKGADEVGTRALAGATAGAALSTAAPMVGRAVQKVADMFKGAMAHSDERLLGHVAEASTAKIRNKIMEKADEAVDAIRTNPQFADKYRDPKALHVELGKEVEAVGGQTQHWYGEAEAKGGKLDPQVVAKAMKAAKDAMTFDEQEVGSALDKHIDKFADRAPVKMTQDAMITRAREGLAAGKAPHIIKSELAGNGLTLDEARREVTRLQGIAFDRLDTTVTTPQREAAGRAAGILKDALERHVDQYAPGGAAVVRDLNAKQTVLLRLEAAAAYKATNAPTAGGTRLSRVMKASKGAFATGVAVAKEGADIAGDAAAAVGRSAAPEGPGRTARASAAIDKTADALTPGPATQRLSQRLAGIDNHGAATQALVEHVFGGAPAAQDDEDKEPFPEFGPSGDGDNEDPFAK